MMKFDFKKIDHKLLIAAGGGLLIAVIVILFLSRHITKTATISNGSTNTALNNPANPDMTISTSHSGALVDVNISPEKPETITALSIRLTVPGTGADISTIKFIPNAALTQSGWTFPINQVSKSADSSSINIDISGIYETPGGFKMTQGVNLGTITGISSLTASLDKSQTKVLDSSANELNLNYTNN